MIPVCPCCGSETNMFFIETETGTSGYRCPVCGCRFIVLMVGTVPDSGDEEEEHARDCWPNRNRLPVVTGGT